MKKIASCVGLAAAIFTQSAWSFSGNDLVSWLPNYELPNRSTFEGGMFLGYVTGVAESLNGIVFCPKNTITNGQNAAIVAKWLRNNPERWSEQGSNLVMEALLSAYPRCKNS